MKKVVLFIIMIMICSINVFASSIYTDKETGVEFTLPENWSEVSFLKEREYIDAKFENNDGTAMIIYGNYDVAAAGFSENEVEEVREYLNMSYITIDDVKEEFAEEGCSNLERVTYNGIDYFKVEMKTTQTIEGQEYDIENIQFIHFNNGWRYSFMIDKSTYYAHYDDFKSLIESVKYPYTNEFYYNNLDLSSSKKTDLSYYELFQQGPAVYVPVIFIMLLITLVAYAIFPLIFAYTRKKDISKVKYNVFCYGINFLVMFFFIVTNGNSSGVPYIIWTGIFSTVGIKILQRRCVLKGYQQKVSAFQDDETTSAEIKERSKISFCRKCGSKLISDSAFCDKCGTEILIEADNATPIKKCELCDKQTDHLTYCEIKDDLGTRYRNICDECVLKYGAKEKENVLQ